MWVTRNAPFQFALSAADLAKRNVLLLQLQQSAVERNKSLLYASEMPVIRGYSEFLDRSFVGSLEAGSEIGFEGGLLKCCTWQADRLVIEIDLPVPEVDKGPCPECNGAKGGDYSLSCITCQGDGRIISYQHARTNAVVAGLSVLLQAMQPRTMEEDERQTDTGPIQLFNLMTSVDNHHAAFGGSFSWQLVRWIKQASDEDLGPVNVAVKSAYRWMMPKLSESFSDMHYNIIRNSGGWIAWTCPGDACSLHPEHGAPYVGEEGYRFGCHNTDIPVQQLTLLAGLAALLDAATAAGVGQ